MSTTDFAALPLSPAQLEALAALGYTQMTPVQAQSIPLVLQGKDVIARARTGSGKTAAFGIGLLQAINPRFFGVQALVLCPTRELAEQVSGELRRLASRMANIKLVTLCGGKPFGPQVGSLEHGAHIVVGTPGRIQDHLGRDTLTLDGLKVLVLDEADRMLDMGFADSMEAIVGKTPKSRQTLLFSATYPENIRKMSASIQRKPSMVTVDDEVAHEEGVIEQLFYEVQKHERHTTLLALFEHYKPANAVVFCNTKKQCDEVAGVLREYDIEARAIHGDLDQRERDQVLVQFANNSCPVLVATDVAARGLDIKSLAMVINYELPRDPDVYVHRIGRTGRAGETGLAMSIIIPSETHRIRKIEEFQNQPCACDTLPSLDRNPDYELTAPMVTIQLDAGRKQKLRPGDILGALTGDAGLEGAQIGKISIFDQWSFVAIERGALRQAMNYLANGKIKGRSIRARKIR
ncbi:ATP-dependent RNA helicase DbpA [Congregibacter sp.]|uniref:ATP-dependent RNA helicase DbpA n=1 Tax=Congregibacter sp. TaxID=2744308 RepID=UPI003F6D87E1